MADNGVLLPVRTFHLNVIISEILNSFIGLDDIVILVVPESSPGITDEAMCVKKLIVKVFWCGDKAETSPQNIWAAESSLESLTSVEMIVCA